MRTRNSDVDPLSSAAATSPPPDPRAVDGQVASGDGAPKSAKDPRIVAGKYQLEPFEKALEENIIVYLGTGCGKTHIAVLLIYELRHLIRKPEKNICVFLAPTVALVQQQARVMEDSLDFKVGIYCGSSNKLKNHQAWAEEVEQYEFFYKPDAKKLPRIFGMTASPVVGKGASSRANLSKSVNSLESLFDAKDVISRSQSQKLPA